MFLYIQVVFVGGAEKAPEEARLCCLTPEIDPRINQSVSRAASVLLFHFNLTALSLHRDHLPIPKWTHVSSNRMKSRIHEKFDLDFWKTDQIKTDPWWTNSSSAGLMGHISINLG